MPEPLDDAFEDDIFERQASRISVPADLIPSLQRMSTSEVLNFASEKQVSTSTKESMLFKVIHHPGFDRFMGIVILLNVVVMVIETDLNANEEEDLSNAMHWTSVFGWVVLGIFAVELLMRLVVFKCEFWQDPWNVFDFMIVVVDLVFSVAGLIADDVFPVSILRIFRLGKLTRALKVLRVFPELRLLLAGVISCLSAIFWGTVLLFFFLLVWALVAVPFIHPLNKEIQYGDGCDRCTRAYSSVLQAMLSFWAQIVTGDSWGQTTIPVIERHPSTAFFFIPLYVSVGMAITNLILGVVVNVAQRSQDRLQEEDKKEKALHKLEAKTKLLQLCRDMDANSDGTLSKEEVFSCMRMEGDFRQTIMSLDIMEDEFDIVWKIIDTEQKGFVSYKALVNALSSMKASNTQFMLAYIKYYMTILRQTLIERIDEEGQKVDDIGRMESKVVEEMTMMIGMETNVKQELLKVEQLIETNMSDFQGNATSGGVSPSRMAISPGESQDLEQRRSSSGSSECAKPSLARDSSDSLLEQIRHDLAGLQMELKGMFTDMKCRFDSLGAQPSPSSKCVQSSRSSTCFQSAREAEGSSPRKMKNAKFDQYLPCRNDDGRADPADASSWSYTSSRAPADLLVVPEKIPPSAWCCQASRERCVVHVEMERGWPSDQETILPPVPAAAQKGCVSAPQMSPPSLDAHLSEN